MMFSFFPYQRSQDDWVQEHILQYSDGDSAWVESLTEADVPNRQLLLATHLEDQ